MAGTQFDNRDKRGAVKPMRPVQRPAQSGLRAPGVRAAAYDKAADDYNARYGGADSDQWRGGADKWNR